MGKIDWGKIFNPKVIAGISIGAAMLGAAVDTVGKQKKEIEHKNMLKDIAELKKKMGES